MKKRYFLLSAFGFNLLLLSSAQSQPATEAVGSQPDLTKSVLGLYVSATGAFAMLQKDPKAILVDVRDPVEIKFTGFAEPTKIHVPYELTDTSNWSDKAQSWPMRLNPNFTTEVLAKLNTLGADNNTTIIIICRSGSTRSAPAVDLLAELGYRNVWSVTDGFEGSTQQSGPSKGVRMVDGWRNSGLPWSYKVHADVAWRPGVVAN
ncbi:rhodanese-like domain-containing protein [Aeromonas salmonicida]|uniref:rhodanese-like domain-containing protein n=1 Tax=Aeromonas salmonicida TaxID=645 RepID=UPI0039A7626C